MTNRKIFTEILIGLFIIIGYACVDNVVNSNSSTPTISITSPKSGDSLRVGKNKITYTAADVTGGPGLQKYEVFVDGASNGVYYVTDTVAVPTLYIVIDSTLLHKKVSAYVTVYNKNSVYKTSNTISNLYIKENTDPPDAPTNLILNKFNATSVVLLWNDNGTNEESYEVWRSAGTENSYGTTPYRTLPKNSTNFSDFGLQSYVTYFYKVRAKNTYGNSAFSNQASTTGGSTSDSPSSLTASPLGASKVHLSWIDNSINENGFEIQRKNVSSSGDWVTAGIVAPEMTEFTDEGLTARTTYTYRVASLLTSSKAFSAEVTVTTATVDVPAPSNLVATFDETIRKVKLTWNDNTVQENGTRIERKVAGGNYAEVGSVSTDTKVFYDSNYIAGAVNYYRVRHVTTEGYFTSYSNEDTAVVPVLPPKAPTNLSIIEVVAGVSYFLDWTDNSNDETGFEIWRKAQSNGTYELYKQVTNGHSITLTDLNPNITYFFKVRAYRSSLVSAYSNEVVSPLQKPTSLTGTVPTGLIQVNLNWTDNAGNETRYEIERRMTGSINFERVGIVGADVTSYSDSGTGLYRGSSYEYRVRAASDITTSGYSNILQISIPY